MAACPESTNCGEIAAFVCQKTHWPDLLGTESQDGLVGNGISREVQRGPDVVRDQPRIGIQEILNSRTFGEFA